MTIRRLVQAALITGVVFCFLAIGSSAAWASTIACTPPAINLGGLISASTGGFTCGDKIYYGFATSGSTPTGLSQAGIPRDWGANFSYTTYPDGSVTHNFTLNAPTQIAQSNGATGTYVLDYYVKIDPTSVDYAINFITSVQVSANLPNQVGDFNNTDTKMVYGPDIQGVYNVLLGTLTTDGGTVGMNIPEEKSVYVVETIYLDGTGEAQGITDLFTETEVPEPATFSLIGVALVGLGLLSRKRLLRG